jgi:spoIIIJ-associated protein
MDLALAKEFVADTEAEAIAKAADHFGVSKAQLEVRALPERLGLSGLGSRVVILASIKEEPAELGPVGEFVAGVLRRMGVAGRIRLDEAEDDGEIVIRLRGEGLQAWLRQDSRVLDALSHLAQRAAQKLIGEEASVRVNVPRGLEVPGSEGGDGPFERLASKTAEEVRKTGKPVVLRPMNSRERWIVHNHIKEMEGLRSESVGEGRMRCVKIEPE